MNKLPKCDYCNMPLSMNNCVLFHMVRWENGVRTETSEQICNYCYDKRSLDLDEEEI